MTAEEKAKELIDRYFNIISLPFSPNSTDYKTAKDCALICVDEMLTYLEDAVTIVCEDGGEKLDPTLYWRQVRQQIQKL